MTATIRAMIGLGLCCLAASPIHAQDYLPHTVDNPLTTEKAPNTTAVGQTKPPSRDASPTSTKAIDHPTRRQIVDETITTKVCTGCRTDPTATGAVPQAPAVVTRDTKLDELQALAPPQPQADLNTQELASAHRERAKSAEEKTDGLWQSWLVSVCEGCGDQKPVRALRYEDWPDRKAPLTTGTVERKATAEKVRAADTAVAPARAHGTMEADLSPQNVDSIRRMPSR